MDLWYGVQVTLIGMLVVFIGLIIIIACIRVLKPRKAKPDAEQAPAAPEIPAAPIAPAVPMAAPIALDPVRPYTPGAPLERNSDPFYAVITAAIAQTLATEGVNPDGGFKIQSIRPVRIPDAPAPSLKDPALYAVLTAAIGQVLAAEGVNPEGGFRIVEARPV
ncbi:MAG: OadG family protein [Oscillospiraceae bacterium]|jgi:Na+-transporting methylmalonyl-CoA/oxaloacetate decarboxylase gamma subunit|nr:OadG family protein [Oscillospiraceae bacterium]